MDTAPREPSLPAHEVDDVAEGVAAHTSVLEDALHELRLSTDRLDDAIEALPVGFELWDRDDKLLAANTTLRRMYPSIAELLRPGSRFDDLVRRNHAAGALAVPAAELDQYIARRRQERRVASGPVEHATSDGRWIRSHEHPTREGGVVGIRIDVTELRAQRALAEDALRAAALSQQGLRDAIEALPDGFALFDADDRLVVCNTRYREMYAASAPAIQIGAYFEDLLRYGLARGQYPQAAADPAAWLAARMQRHRNPAAPEIQQLPDNRWLRIDERHTRSGGIAGVRSDVTELVRREQQLVELNAKLQEARAELEALAQTDSLTGIANRRHFDRRLAEEWSFAARRQTPLALLLIDIDYFKRYNDHYGHPEGDNCLRQVAAVLLACARRSTDVVARIGGEEFAILAPDTGHDDAMMLASRCQQALARAGIEHRGSTVAAQVTMSIGGTVVGDVSALTMQALMHRADQALYGAKAAGRNRVEFG